MSSPARPKPEFRTFQIAGEYLAICARDVSRGGVKTDQSGFNFVPDGECIITDSPVDLEQML